MLDMNTFLLAVKPYRAKGDMKSTELSLSSANKALKEQLAKAADTIKR